MNEACQVLKYDCQLAHHYLKTVYFENFCISAVNEKHFLWNLSIKDMSYQQNVFCFYRECLKDHIIITFFFYIWKHKHISSLQKETRYHKIKKNHYYLHVYASKYSYNGNF